MAVISGLFEFFVHFRYVDRCSPPQVAHFGEVVLVLRTHASSDFPRTSCTCSLCYSFSEQGPTVHTCGTV